MIVDMYDKWGKAISVSEWGALNRDDDYKVVAQSLVTSGTNPAISYGVSTVWLGMNHNCTGGVPLIFETMVFDHGSTGWRGEDCRRYATLEDAERGHLDMLAKVRKAVPDAIVSAS